MSDQDWNEIYRQRYDCFDQVRRGLSFDLDPGSPYANLHPEVVRSEILHPGEKLLQTLSDHFSYIACFFQGYLSMDAARYFFRQEMYFDACHYAERSLINFQCVRVSYHQFLQDITRLREIAPSIAESLGDAQSASLVEIDAFSIKAGRLLDVCIAHWKSSASALNR